MSKPARTESIFLQLRTPRKFKEVLGSVLHSLMIRGSSECLGPFGSLSENIIDRGLNKKHLFLAILKVGKSRTAVLTDLMSAASPRPSSRGHLLDIFSCGREREGQRDGLFRFS